MKDLEILLSEIDTCIKSNDVLKEEVKDLFSKWYAFANKYSIEEELIYEWQNDMDARRLIDQALEKLSLSQKSEIEKLLLPLDTKVKENTFEVNECIWGKKNEQRLNYNPKANWYYYRVNQLVFDSERESFTKKYPFKTDWQALSKKLGILKEDGSEMYQGINSSQALEEILGDEWLQDALDTFIEGKPGNELAIKTLRFIYSPKAAAMAFKIYDENKDSNQQKASIAVWALSDIRTKEALDYVEVIIKRPEYEAAAFSVLRNLIFDHLQWFEGNRLLGILDIVSDDYREDAEGLKNFIRMESTSLLPNLSNDFSVKQFQFLKGTIGYMGGSYSIIVPIEKFVLDDKVVETELRLDRILLPDALKSYVGKIVNFPINPIEGYIDGSVYLKDAHSPIDVTEIEFIGLEENILNVKLKMNFIFEYEGIGFKNEELINEVRLLCNVDY
jgi:hypothetical protein